MEENNEQYRNTALHSGPNNYKTACVGLALDSSKPQFMKKSPPQLKANNQPSDVKPDKGI